MPIVLYHIPVSPPCRAVEMTAEHLGIELVKKHVDVFAGEQLKQEFLAINPQHCVPTIDDAGFILWESRAIQKYLVNQYAPKSPLYPSDPKARAVVDKILDFDLGNLHRAVGEFCRKLILEPESAEIIQKEENMKKSFAIFEKMLEKTPYAAGNHLTIADYSILSMLAIVELVEYNLDEFPKISAWFQRVKKETPKYREINEIPLKEFKEHQKTKK